MRIATTVLMKTMMLAIVRVTIKTKPVYLGEREVTRPGASKV